MFITTIRTIVYGIVCALATSVAYADTHVANHVSVQSTGSNSTSVVRTYTSGSRATVDITSVINGETVLDIHEVSDGEPIRIDRTETRVNDAAASAHVRLRTPPEYTASPHTAPAPALVPIAPEQDAIDVFVSEAPYPPVHITNITNPTSDARYDSEEESHDDPLVTRIARSIAHTITYVFTFIF